MYGKSTEEILEMRKDDLTQRAGENLIEFKNRASRFSREIARAETERTSGKRNLPKE